MPQVPRRLGIEPKLCTRAKRRFETKRRVGSDASLALDDLVHPLERHVDSLANSTCVRPSGPAGSLPGESRLDELVDGVSEGEP